MKKLLLVSLCFLLLSVAQVFAQNRTVTGTVIAKEDGGPIPGVSVKVKGTTLGVITGADGKYSIRVPETGKTLVFAFIGYGTIERPITGSVVNATLEVSSKALAEVEVTSAFGIKTNSRASSTSAQAVSSEELNTVRQPNINNALAGKVAGIQVRSQSTGDLDRPTEVRLRGATGFGSGRGAIYVVDGTILPNSNDINLDDVEDVTVLQGAAAGAIFGSAGANGAIVMTTKKGKKGAGVAVDLNLGAKFDMAYILPNYQNVYAGGNNPDLTQYVWKAGDPTAWQALSGKYYPDYSDDSSWGPKMVGQEYIPWYSWYPGTQYSYKTASLTPNPNNARDFYQTGLNFDNTVAVSKATDDYNVRFSLGNQSVRGIVPDQDLRKTTLNLNASVNINKHLTFAANITYLTQKQNGLVNDAYSNQTSGSFNQWFHRDLDMGIMKELRALRTPSGVYASWNHADPNTYDPSKPDAFYAGNYWYNFYTYQDLVNQANQRDRLFGNISLAYKVNNDLTFKFTYRKQQNTTFSSTIFQSELAQSGVQTTGNEVRNKGYYASSNSYSNRDNFEFLATYNKTFKDFNVNLLAGSDNYRSNQVDDSANTNNGLTIPDLYTINNSVDAPTIGNNRIKEAYNAIFGTASIGYKNIVTLNGTLRNDWFSTLPPTNNSVLSKSIGASFIFSELLKSKVSWLSLGKLRATYGQVPEALGTTNETFGFGRYPGAAYSVSAQKFNGSNLLMQTADTYVDPNIHGAVKTEREVGVDFGFLDDRIQFSATYWDGTEVGLPATVTVNAASGFTSILTNFGKTSKNGLDFSLSGTPVQLKNFKWTITANYENLLHDFVDEISDKYNVHIIPVATNTYTQLPYLYQVQGMPWGELYGNGIARNANGDAILNASGFYTNNPNTAFGSVLPKHIGGIQNQFTIFKDFTLDVNIDGQVGGKFASLSNFWGSYSGLTARTAALNDKGIPVRDPVANGGGIHTVGVDATTGKPVSYYVDAYTYYQNNYNNKTGDEFVYDLTFIKLREAGITYRIPVRKLGISKYVRNASFQVEGTDLWLLYAKTKDFDPSQISAVQGESGQLPGTRGIGFNLRVGF